MHALTTRIEAVTVYREGARVRRVGELAPAASGRFPEQIAIGGLPLCLEDSSLRLKLEPMNGSAIPVAADLRVTLALPEDDPDLAPVDDEVLAAARAKAAETKARVKQLERELERLRALTLSPRPEGDEGKPPGESPVASRVEFLHFRAEREAALAAQLPEARAAAAEAKRRERQEADRYDRQSTRRRPQSDELRKVAVVRIVSPNSSASAVRVAVEYVVPGARWVPSYTLQFDHALRSAQLGLRASIAQRTGEDWDQVAVTLSTAEPDVWTELPELASRRIGRRQRRPEKTGWRPPPIGAEVLFEDWDRAFPQPRESAPPATRRAQEMPAMASEGLDHVEAHFQMLDEPDMVTMSPPAAGAAPGRAAKMVAASYIPPQSVPIEAVPRSKSGGVAGALAGAAAAPAALLAQGVGALFDKKRSSAVSLGPPASFAASPSEAELEPPALEPGDLLRYGDLRMKSATSRERGRLVLVSQQTLYLELLAVQQVTLDLSLDQLLLMRQADALEAGRTLPPGHSEVWSEHYDYAYDADAPVDIASDGDFHAITLTWVTGEAAPRYVVVPRESTDVFRTVEVKNPTDAPLLPGPVDVYRAGRFMLTANLDFTPPKAGFELGLGVEQGVKVARNTRFREESGGLLSKQLELHHEIDVDVRNNLDRAAHIEVRDRLPVTREDEDDIEVKEVAVSPAWQGWEPEPESPGEAPLEGGRRWILTLEPGAARTLHAHYSIDLPAKNELVGGNRREV